jgi:hypothetical protein
VAEVRAVRSSGQTKEEKPSRLQSNWLFELGAIGLGVSLLTLVAVLWAASPFRGDARHFVAVAAYSSLAAAVFTTGGAVAAILYVILTFRLWEEAARQVETQRRIAETTLMQTLMVEYDGLRDDIQRVQEFYASFQSKEDALTAFTENRRTLRLDWIGLRVDPSRFRISRFFVKIRKLAGSGYLDEELIVTALGREHIEDVFLKLIDPLDQEVAFQRRGSNDLTDRHFYEGLAKKVSAPVG